MIFLKILIHLCSHPFSLVVGSRHRFVAELAASSKLYLSLGWKMAKRERHSLATNKSASLEADGHRLSILQKRLLVDPQFAGKDSRSKKQPASDSERTFGSFSYHVSFDCWFWSSGYWSYSSVKWSCFKGRKHRRKHRFELQLSSQWTWGVKSRESWATSAWFSLSQSWTWTTKSIPGIPQASWCKSSPAASWCEAKLRGCSDRRVVAEMS